MAVATGSLFGLGPTLVGGSIDLGWGREILVALVVVVGYRQLRRPGFFPGLWPVAAAAAANWFLTALNAFPGREPTSSRYQYAGAIFIVLILANLFKGVRVSRAVVIVGAIVTALAVGPNLIALKNGADVLKQQSVFTRADTAAIEIAERTVAPDFQLNPEVAGTPSLINVFAGEYLQAVEEYGSPAYTPAELAGAPEEGRRQADIVLAQALPISATRLPGQVGGNGATCVTVPGGAAASDVPIAPGRTRIEVAPGPHADLTMRRFAVGEYPVTVRGAPGDSVTVLHVPRDSVARPWRLHVDAEQPVRVCRQ
jgi:hypothetical protein